MRILIFTAIHGRQHITDLFLMGVKRLELFSGHDIKLFCVASDLADIEYLQVREIDFCVAPNRPLSEKLEHGFKEACKLNFDYMLRMGSDDLLDHDVFKLHYNDLMAAGVPYFGFKTIGVVEFETLESIVYQYDKHRKDHILGGGSMLSKDLCDKLKDKPLYNKRPLNRGLDAASEEIIKSHCPLTVVSTAYPMLIDVKGNDKKRENIHPFFFVSKRQRHINFSELTKFLSIEETDYLRNKGAKLRCVAVIPVHGRLPLLRHTIERLIKKNGVFKVICVGSEVERPTCEHYGADFVLHENKPLGKKWNAGFMKAKEYNPDYCLFVGSSDWISDNWLSECEQYIHDFDMIGKPDFYLLDYGKQLRLCHWAGYTDARRKDEPIGIGRLLSKRILDKMGWQPMDPALDSSLDYSMWQKVLNMRGKVKMIKSDEIKSLSLSTDAWINKHRFADHWDNKKGVESKKMEHQEFLTNHFPEAFKL